MMEHPAVSVMFKGHIANLVDVEAVFERFLTLYFSRKKRGDFSHAGIPMGPLNLDEFSTLKKRWDLEKTD